MPGVDNTTRIKQMRKCRGTLSRGIRNIQPGTIERAVKYRIEVTTQDSRDRWVDPGGDLLKKLVSCRVAIWLVQGNDTKRFILETELTRHKTASIIRREVDKRQRGTKENDTTTRFLRTRRHNRLKARRTKPRLTLDITHTMCLLKTHHIRDYRKGSQPQQETRRSVRISNTVNV